MPNTSPSKEEVEKEGYDGPAAEILKQQLISWQECFSISEEYFPDKIVVLSANDYYNDNIVSYNCNLQVTG